MTYDPKKIEVGTIKQGTRTEGAVVRIDEGRIKDFYKPENLAKFEDRNPDGPAINVIFEYQFDGQQYSGHKTIALPFNNKAHPKSTMAKWKMQYGDFPLVGQKVTLVANENGYFEVLC